MSIARIAFTKHDGKGSYSGYLRQYEPHPDFPRLAQWEGKTVGVDFEARIFHVSDAAKNYCRVPFEDVLAVNVEMLGYTLREHGQDLEAPGLLPNLKGVRSEGYGADIKYAYYLRDAGKETPESKACIKACIEAFEASRR